MNPKQLEKVIEEVKKEKEIAILAMAMEEMANKKEDYVGREPGEIGMYELGNYLDSVSPVAKKVLEKYFNDDYYDPNGLLGTLYRKGWKVVPR